MKILMALSQLQVTGAEVYAVEVAKKLIEKKHDVFFVSDTLTKEIDAPYFPLSFNKRNIFQRFGHIIKLISIIKKNKIDLVHAHSRASAWSAEYACKLTNTPFVTTIHGMQHTSKLRKRKQPVGRGFTVCENIRSDLINTFDVDPNSITVLRNGIDLNKFHILPFPENSKKVISIIGRLSGPKGDVTYNLLKHAIDLDKYIVNIIGGEEIPAIFEPFKEQANFTGYIENVSSYMAQSDLVIGAGRVAMESLLMGRPTLAIGEAKEIGVIESCNIQNALSSNFGDVGDRSKHNFDWSFIKDEIEKGVALDQAAPSVVDTIKSHFNIDNIVDTLEKAYQHEYVYTKKHEIPVIMYHRVIKHKDTETGKHGTYVTDKQFFDHMQILKDQNYTPITFKCLEQIPLHKRFEKKYIILTFDDGYEDNYLYAFPILKKFGFKAVIFLVSNLKFNKWDVSLTDEKKFNLMTLSMLNEMLESKLIEFGGHTLTHPFLTKLSHEELSKEIHLDKKITEEKLDIKLTTFAYPYGDLNLDVKNIVKEAGYSFGVSTDSGSAAISDDLFQIRRIAIFPSITPFGFKRKIKGNYNFIKIKRELRKASK